MENKTKQTVLVLGATGNLGAYSAVYLKEQGYNVIACGHRESDNGFFAEKGIDYYSIDIEKPEDFKKLPQQSIDCVAHFAGQLPARYAFNPVKLFESITIGTLNVLEYMRSINCGKIIFPQTPSDMARYHNNGSVIPSDAPRHFPMHGDHAIYTIAKNAAVDLIEYFHSEYGIKGFVLRFFTIYQYHPNPWHYDNYKRRMMPYRQIMDKASKGEPIEIWGNADKAKEMVYIKDFVRVVERCVANKGEGGIYNVGNGWQVSLREQIQGIVDVFSPEGKKSEIIECPEKPDPLENAFDIEKTFRELDYAPEYSYMDQLRDFRKEMENEPFAKLWGKKEDYM